MRRSKVIVCGLAVCAASSFVARPAWAAACLFAGAYKYEALIDADNSQASGGPVTVVQGAEAPHDVLGVDYIVRVGAAVPLPEAMVGAPIQELNGDGPHIIYLEVLNWDGDSFNTASCSDPNYPIGDGEGVGGSQLVEFQAPLPLTLFPATPLGQPFRVVFHASRAAGPANDYTADALVGQVAIVAVPTLSGLGFTLLIGALWLACFALLRRRRRAAAGVLALLLLGATAAWAASAFLMDGDNADWTGLNPEVTDVSGDSSVNDPAEDILAGFAVREAEFLTFRMDILGKIQSE